MDPRPHLQTPPHPHKRNPLPTQVTRASKKSKTSLKLVTVGQVSNLPSPSHRKIQQPPPAYGTPNWQTPAIRTCGLLSNQTVREKMSTQPNSLRTSGRKAKDERSDTGGGKRAALLLAKVVLYLACYSLAVWLEYLWIMDRIGGPSAYGYEFFAFVVLLPAAFMVYPLCASIMLIASRRFYKRERPFWLYCACVFISSMLTPFVVFAVLAVVAMIAP